LLIELGRPGAFEAAAGIAINIAPAKTTLHPHKLIRPTEKRLLF
jgi:hypothetical protein